MLEKVKYLLERSAFGVCSYLGEKLGVATTQVRLYFIYLTFAALDLPLYFIFLWLFGSISNNTSSKKETLSGNEIYCSKANCTMLAPIFKAC